MKNEGEKWKKEERLLPSLLTHEQWDSERYNCEIDVTHTVNQIVLSCKCYKIFESDLAPSKSL